MSKINSLLLVIVLLVSSANCYKILAVFPHMGKSHFATFEPILKALVARGNEVTVLSEFPQKSPLPGYNDVILESADEINTEILHIKDIPAFWISKLANTIVLAKFGRQSCNHLSQKSVRDLIKSNEVFDVILIEYFNTDCFLGFAHKFKAPFIGLSSCVLMPYHNERMGNPDNPSYITQHFGDYHIPMTFLERVENTVAILYHKFMYKILADLPGNQIARQYFGEDLPPLSEIARNTSLFFVNSHFSLNRPRPLVPGFIEIGGVHIGKQKDLPQTVRRKLIKEFHIYFHERGITKYVEIHQRRR